jgi:hypothetical protein
MNRVEKDYYFQCTIRIGFCAGLKILCFQANGIVGFGDLNLFVGLAYQGKDIVFRFIIECSSLMDFGPPRLLRSILI